MPLRGGSSNEEPQKPEGRQHPPLLRGVASTSRVPAARKLPAIVHSGRNADAEGRRSGAHSRLTPHNQCPRVYQSLTPE